MYQCRHPNLVSLSSVASSMYSTTLSVSFQVFQVTIVWLPSAETMTKIAPYNTEKVNARLRDLANARGERAHATLILLFLHASR